MYKSRVRLFTFSSLIILLAVFILLGGFHGVVLKGAAAAGVAAIDRIETTTASAKAALTGIPVLTGTVTVGTGVIIVPVTGTTNLVLASQILGFDLDIRAGNVASTPAVSETAASTPSVISPTAAARTPTATLSESSAVTPTGGLTSRPVTSGLLTTTPSGSKVVPGSGDLQIGTVVDILIINPIQFPHNTGVQTPVGGVTPRVIQIRSTPSSNGTEAAPPAVSPTTTGAQTETSVPTISSAPTTSTTTMPTQSRTPASGVLPGSPMGSAVTESQIVFVIARLDGPDANYGLDNTKNLVAIPWDKIQVVPSEKRLIVNASESSIRNFPFFSQADWATLGTTGALGFWFEFWNLVPPVDLRPGSIPEPGAITQTPIPEIQQTPAGSSTQTAAP